MIDRSNIKVVELLRRKEGKSSMTCYNHSDIITIIDMRCDSSAIANPNTRFDRRPQREKFIKGNFPTVKVEPKASLSITDSTLVARG
jgi:hypothetical protein